ncbi:MAG: MFS transporter [Caldilineaceae bacterium]|nr:MFS transporter [Caldilineaceae bacterium]
MGRQRSCRLTRTEQGSAGLLAPLAQPNYRHLLLSSILWWQTYSIWVVVAGVVVLDMTDSALAIALLTFWRRAAQLAFGGFAGFIGDRLGRRNTLTLSQVVIFAACVSLLLLFEGGRLNAWQITAAAFIIGAGWTVDAPARAALVPDLLGSRLSADAMMLESLTHSILIGVGAYLAGWLLDSYGAAAGFGALIALTGINLALLIRLGRLQVPQTIPVADGGVWQSIGEGVNYLRSNRAMLVVVLISALVNIMVFPALSLMPVFARDVFERGAIGLGTLNGSYSIGLFAGLFLTQRLRRNLSFYSIFVAGSLLQCVAWVLFALSPLFNLAILLQFLAGVGQAGFYTMRNVILLTSSNNEMRGRAMSTVALSQGVGLPGELVTGSLAEAAGPRLAVSVQGALATLAALAIFWKGKSARAPSQ